MEFIHTNFKLTFRLNYDIGFFLFGNIDVCVCRFTDEENKFERFEAFEVCMYEIVSLHRLLYKSGKFFSN